MTPPRLTGETQTYARGEALAEAQMARMVRVGLLSLILAQTLPGPWAAPISGFAYFLIGTLQFVNGRYFDTREVALQVQPAPAAADPEG